MATISYEQFMEINYYEGKIIKYAKEKVDGFTADDFSKESYINRNLLHDVLNGLCSENILEKREFGDDAVYSINRSTLNTNKNDIDFLVKKKNVIEKVGDIRSTEDLRDYLDTKIYEESRKEDIIQYTTLDSVKSMFDSNMIVARKHDVQNDKYELECFNEKCWENLYSTSFMQAAEENIAMWVMYGAAKGGKINKGIQISLSSEDFRDWASKIDTAYLLDSNYEKIKEIKGFSRNTHRVAYTKISPGGTGSHELKIGWDRKKWSQNEYDNDRLAGYIKDFAWEYEKEIRISVWTNDSFKNKMIGIPMDKNILSKIKFTLSPWADAEIRNDPFFSGIDESRIFKSKFFDKVDIPKVLK